MRHRFWLCLLLGIPACTSTSTQSGLRVRSVSASEDGEQPMATSKTKRSPAQKIADLKETVNQRMNKVAAGVNKGVTDLNARVEHSVGNMMSKSNAVMDDIHSAASNVMQGVKDFGDAASDPIVRKVNNRTAVMNSKVKLMISKINKAIDDMKNGAHELATGMTNGMKEASEKISAQLAQSVHEHIRQEIELARAAEPAS
mmetsp:Transcript_56566/g.113541  ORF Transcript_56566/g.113541 Transcript_56566/m.113541 type:complete len:200 (-) Transcript_56566:41-640(-)